MQTWWPSSKKCSTAEKLLTLSLFLAFAATSSLLEASPRKAATLASATPSSLELLVQIRDASRQPTFEPLLRRWEILYGDAAVTPLLQISAGSGTDSLRYIALMGAARLGGRTTAPRISKFLRDPSWMLRSGALRAMTGLRDPATAPTVLPLLHDPSLAVRLEAVTATAQLKPAGAAQALLRELASEQNYRNGKALWVPGRALAALAALHASQAASSLAPLLDHTGDPDLQLETLATLETLTGRTLKPGAPLSVRIREWKLALNSR